jgi:DNA-binding NtrC family response regulator
MREIDRACSYDWPGNVRELQNVVERAVIIATGTYAAAPELGQREQARGASPPADLRALEEVEAEHIAGVLALVNWVIEGKRGAASILGLEPSTLRYRMQRLGIQRPKRGDQA